MQGGGGGKVVGGMHADAHAELALACSRCRQKRAGKQCCATHSTHLCGYSSLNVCCQSATYASSLASFGQLDVKLGGILPALCVVCVTRPALVLPPDAWCVRAVAPPPLPASPDDASGCSASSGASLNTSQ